MALLTQAAVAVEILTLADTVQAVLAAAAVVAQDQDFPGLQIQAVAVVAVQTETLFMAVTAARVLSSFVTQADSAAQAEQLHHRVDTPITHLRPLVRLRLKG